MRYNIGGNAECRNIDFLETLCATLNTQLLLIYDKPMIYYLLLMLMLMLMLVGIREIFII